MKRLCLALLLAAFATVAAAQSGARPRPPGTLPLEEVPPPPPMPATDAPDANAIESRSVVTTRVEGDQTIQEYRVNGKLFMQRVTPKYGRPYVLMDNRGDGTFQRMDTLEPGLRVPQWVLIEF